MSYEASNGRGFPHWRAALPSHRVERASVTRRANHLANLATPLSSPFRKNILIFRKRKPVHIFAVPSLRGAFRDRHGRGAGCGGRTEC
jgi:hypothetical protein